MEPELRSNLRESSTWKRLVFMVIFAIAFQLAELLLAAVAVIQFLFRLVTGECNDRLAVFGAGLAEYLRRVVAYLTFASDSRPFPFDNWPDAEPERIAPAPPEGDDPTNDGY
ncbi:protein of unknown function [Thiohalospira halophila DSM 15071]|uniref:Lipase n=1 Tax=Thiohalospira halophila DSM 15071 TaxID=1123397 RepID=A0A1I1QWK1_9GAMM|nr:DUF4389 domain-containing protein [Thiohalospira halophila]SFD26524.1 protein of unknown function [Thiohalospira halophila DSM 15071]